MCTEKMACELIAEAIHSVVAPGFKHITEKQFTSNVITRQYVLS